MTTDSMYCTVTGDFYSVDGDDSTPLDGVIRVYPRIPQATLDDGTLQILLPFTIDIVDGQILHQGKDFFTLPATADGIPWDIETFYSSSPKTDRFVIKSYPGAIITPWE